MHIEQNVWTPAGGWEIASAPDPRAQLVLAFGARDVLADAGAYERLAQRYPKAHIVTCSTAGEISGTRVLDDTLTTTAVSFEGTGIRVARTTLDGTTSSREAGRFLGRELAQQGLVHVLVLSDGLRVNGSELAAGIADVLPPTVAATGGLSADGSRFTETLVGLDAPPAPNSVVAVGFYGDRLHVGYGSLGGWDPFGPDRLITRSEGNVLFELDGLSALQLYREYLGTYAADLPASGLLFPLLVHDEDNPDGLVRTVLAIDDERQSMTFAGDLPEGSYARLMKANFDRLIDGATGAAHACRPLADRRPPDLAVLISCVGRKLVLQQRIEEEVEGVRDVLGADTALTGFYSYGELSPVLATTKCELHNQTMTITTFAEL